jgi:hypothetical protein
MLKGLMSEMLQTMVEFYAYYKEAPKYLFMSFYMRMCTQGLSHVLAYHGGTGSLSQDGTMFQNNTITNRLLQY